MKRALKIIGFTLLNIVLVLLAVEAFFRAFVPVHPVESMGWFWRVPDPITGWSLEPGAEGRSYNEMYEYDVAVKVNSRGLRSPESIGYEKPEGVYRIMVLGDSFVEGIQVELEETFGQQLSRILNEKGHRVEVINAGVGGWGNDQELLWLREEGYKYKPDLIILTLYPRNDFMNNHQPLESANMGANLKPYFRLEEGELKLELFPFDPAQAPPVEREDAVVKPDPVPPGPLTPVGEWLWRHSYFYRWVDPRIRLLAPRFAASLARLGVLKPGKEMRLLAQGEDYVPLAYNIYDTEPDEEWQAAYEMTVALLGEIKKEARDMGADLVAVLANSPEEVYPGYWDQVEARYPRMKGKSWSMEAAHARMLAALAENDIPALDLRPAFRREAERRGHMLHFAIDGHWNREGHQVAAQEIARFLEMLNLLPPTTSGIRLVPAPFAKLL
ncbi:MAG: hypothetical protein GXP42_09540 [Chloroflexi bacterium]|nr:hypothetical protein [Chloroflexota bacterium]